MNKRSLAVTQCLVLMPLLALLAACSTTYQTYHAEQSGFLGDYSQLRRGHGNEALWVYINTNNILGPYTRIMVDPITLYLAKKHGGPLAPRDLKEDALMTMWALWTQFAANRKYTEKEVNAIVNAFHTTAQVLNAYAFIHSSSRRRSP